MPILPVFLALALQSELPPPQRIEVLFLGDRGHHEPAARAQQVLPELRTRGIDLFYDESLEALTPQNLAKYDALLVYANHDRGEARHVKAIVDYVERGGALVALHCASYCFIESPEWIALVGAQFQSHGAEVFRETFVAPAHALLAPLQPIASWDETYVHHRHASDREILAVREHSGGAEPYTWLRRQGQGRVFYTAWGHDQRTWSKPEFVDLLERGVRWSIGDEALARPRPVAPFTFSPARVPNYEPGGPADALGKMQDPLAPRDSLARAVVPPELELKLFANEPFLSKPLCMAFDERGRMFVGESTDYPNELGAKRDVIRVLEDRDGDGECDSFTLFAGNLSIPTSLCSSNGGVIALCPPDVLFLKDTDGDGRADERRTLFSGFGTGDTHATGSNLRYAPDGWIWGTVGYSGFRGKVGGEEHAFNDALFRFRADGSELEVMGSTSNNTWGLGFSEDGAVFGSTANGNPSVHLAIPHRYYEAVEGANPGVLPTIADSLRIHPITRGVRQVDWHGLFTAAAGHALYTARAFPREYWNRVAFVTEPTGHVVARFFLEPSGAGFAAREGWNLLASDDEWTAPIAAEVGPDGAVWVLDWYNYIVQHNPTPPGFENGPGNAYVTPLRDKTHGRVWRVQPKGFRAPVRRDLAQASPEELVATLRADNMLWRLHAQRLLVERGKLDVVDALVALLARPQRDELGLDVGGFHALHTLALLGALREERVRAAAERALETGTPEVRRAALAVLPKDARFARSQGLAMAFADPIARNRLAVLLALCEIEPDPAIGGRIAELLADKAFVEDRILADALLCAAARHAAGFLRQTLATQRQVAQGAAAPVAVQLLPNDGFEELARADRPKGWLVRHYSGEAQQRVVSAGRSGNALELSSASGADTSYYAEVQLDPDATYRLSGWIKTEGLDASRCYGACLNVHEIQGGENARTPPVSGTSDWKRVEVTFEAGGRTEATINCLFGGWGWGKGKAWFDDVKLELVSNPGLPGPAGRIVSRVTRHYAHRVAGDDVVDVLRALDGAPEPLAAALLSGLVDGWPQGRAPRLAAETIGDLTRVATGLAPQPRALLAELALSRWGLAQEFSGLREVVVAQLERDFTAENLPWETRAAAARRLVSLVPPERALALLLAGLDLDSESEFASAVLEALGERREELVGIGLVAELGRLAPAVQRTAARVLRSRVAWTRTLLAAIEAGDVPAAILEPAAWQELSQHPDTSLREFAERVRRKGQLAVAVDIGAFSREIAALRGDATRGREVFRQNCAVCHAVGGEGGPVGPALDGIGARPLDEVLISILDPSRNVEANYQLWVARTFDERIVSGRLMAETRTALELLDSSAKSQILPRDEIESIAASPLSLMPAGFESLGAQALADVLALLRGEH
jgi:putative membrane-bound dehydrogenase-like protein